MRVVVKIGVAAVCDDIYTLLFLTITQQTLILYHLYLFFHICQIVLFNI